MLKVSATHTNWIELPHMALLATLIMIGGSAEVEDGPLLPKYSTWYVLPDSSLRIRSTSAEELIVFIANPVL